LFLVLTLFCLSSVSAQETGETAVHRNASSGDPDTYLVKILNTPGSSPGTSCNEPVRQLYKLNGGSLIWSDDGELSQQAINAINHLGQAAQHGLNPHAYRIEELQRRLSTLRNETVTDSGSAGLLWAEFDVVVSTALVHFVSDIYRGRINPLETGFNVVVTPKHIDLAEAVYSLSESLDFGHEIQKFEPRLRAYKRLKQELARYRKLHSRITFPALNAENTVHPGEQYADTEKLQIILEALGDYARPSVSNDDFYSAGLVEAVKRFQVRHGLEDDGVIGAKTFSQLNTPISKRIEQIEFSMERLRWLSTPKNGQHIVVNIPAFELYGFEVENGTETLTTKMKVIVGSAINKHDTPVFAADMEYLVFRPYWNVPYSITVNELLPKLTLDPGYLGENRYEVVHENQVVRSDNVLNDVHSEILKNLGDGTYRLRQQPGENNALGLIKFIFPNSNSIYLHDTPAHKLFNQSRRDFSHGCIRVEDPPGLAQFVLRDQGISWEKQEIIQATRSEDDQKVSLEHHIPVHIFYTTTIVRDNGTVAFFDDIYGHDKTLRNLLMKHGVNHCSV
jgi:murein L,D-transpeptidase YcbB/YkuD